MPTHTQNVIHETTDYAQFHLLTANRDTIRSHIENIKKSIERNGNFTKFAPVLVNENMEIIDGQHRFTALKELGLPVHFVVTTGSGVREAREMNKLNKGWGMLDWAKTYANTGHTSYRNFLVLIEEYPNIAPSVVLQYALGGYEKGIYATFRDGDMVLSNHGVERARQRLDTLTLAAEIHPNLLNGSLAEAFLEVLENPDFELKRMIAKLKEYPEVSKFQSKQDNLRHLEEIYNYRYRAGNRVRFF